jgi:hypothetical protein
MKIIFENWRKHLEDADPESNDKPRVICNCLCTDCVFNKNEQCVAEEINLDFAQTAEGRTICECLTYDIRDDERPDDAIPFDEEPTLEES